jgi:hypothetical protein
MSDRPFILDYARSRRWWRRYMSRESFLDFFKTMLWVVPLTILIWVYAEQEQVAEDKSEVVLIQLRSTDPNRIVTLGNPGNESIVCDLRGPRAKLEYVKAELTRPVTIDVPAAYNLGPQQFETAHLRDAGLFVSNGIMVSNIHPLTIPINIDVVDQREVPVVAPEPNNLASAIFDPRTVTIRGPHTLFSSPEFKKDLIAIADISANPELSRPGQHPPTTLPVVSPLSRAASGRGESITISPPNVTATITVQQTAGELTIGSMPVWVEGAQPVLDEFRAVNAAGGEGALFVKEVKVVGPADQLELLRNQSYIPHATLTIKREDAQAGATRQRTLWFDNGSLPPGVSVSRADRERPFEFKVVPRGKP